MPYEEGPKPIDQIMTEVKNLGILFDGIVYLLENKGVLMGNKDLSDLIGANNNLEQTLSVGSLPAWMILAAKTAALEEMRRVAKKLGISEEDLTDEKLRGYSEIQDAERREEEIKMHSEGGSPEEKLLRSIFRGGPTKH